MNLKYTIVQLPSRVNSVAVMLDIARVDIPVNP
jgi:hypothetical protein